MQIELLINNSTDEATRYIGWSRTKCVIRITPAAGEQVPAEILLRNIQNGTGGKMVFLNAPGDAESDELLVTVSAAHTATVFIAGKYPDFSKGKKDAGMEIVGQATGNVLHTEAFMVRVRRNANEMNADERKIFLDVFQKINNKGNGRFADFRLVHIAPQSQEGSKYYYQAHGYIGFLPWHRAFLLDLEREMQAIDPRASLPYWKFDTVCKNMFTQDFMGEHTGKKNAKFSLTNPLNEWRADGTGINRTADFNVTTEYAHNEFGEYVLTEDQVMKADTYEDFANLEGNPHGTAHTSFNLDLTNPDTSVKDPLFFMLHTNVDRLWAKWQWKKDRFDKADDASYPQDNSRPPGHNINDTFWPWNNVTGGTRPQKAPGGTLAPSKIVTAPGLSPKLSDMIDWQGRNNNSTQLGFDYDDVGFIMEPDLMEDFAVEDTSFTQPVGTFTLANVEATELLTSEVKEEALRTMADSAADPSLKKMVVQRSGSSISNEDDFISSLLNIIGNKEEQDELRSSALVKLQQLMITSAGIEARRAELTNILRGIVTDANAQIRLRVMTILAAQKDAFVHEKLKEGLETPAVALLAPEDAIILLGYDIHADIYPLLRKLVSAPPNEETRLKAIELLGHDSTASGILNELMQNKAENAEVRIAASKALQLADMELFNTEAKKLVLDKDENDDVRTALLHSLSFNTEMRSVKEDEQFLEKVNTLGNTDISAQMQIVTDRFLGNMK